MTLGEAKKREAKAHLRAAAEEVQRLAELPPFAIGANPARFRDRMAGMLTQIISAAYALAEVPEPQQHERVQVEGDSIKVREGGGHEL
ncbi:MAG TPA: hypothetical protein VFX47_02915 [Gammaproteobacteria bacterium]|nr:hypothetical protein [Gammaproteobacteria bacterium]